MKPIGLALVALFAAAGHLAPAQAQTGYKSIIAQAIDAQGGVDRAACAEGTVDQGRRRPLGYRAIRRSRTASRAFSAIRRSRSRGIWRTARPAAIGTARRSIPSIEHVKYTEVVTPKLGYVVNDKGANQPMSGIRIATGAARAERDIADAPAQGDGRARRRAAAGQRTARQDADAGDRICRRRSELYDLVRPQEQAAGGGAHARRRQHRRRLDFDVVLGDWKPVGGVKIAARAVVSARNGVRDRQGSPTRR